MKSPFKNPFSPIIMLIMIQAMFFSSCGEHDTFGNSLTDNGGVQSGYQMALTTFTIDKRTVSQNELFTIRTAMKNVATLDPFPGGQIGTALIGSDGNIITVIGSRSLGTLNAGSTSSAADAYNFVPDTITPGQYKLRIVVKPTGGDWKLVTLSMVGDDVPTINFEVTPAESEETDDGYGLALTSFASNKTSVSQNELFNVSSAFRSVSLDTFPGGQIGTAIVNSNGNIIAIIGSRNRSALNPGATIGTGDNYCYVPNTVAAGTYSLKTAIKPNDGMWRVASMSIGNAISSIDFTVATAAAGETDDGYGMALTSFTTSKISVSQNELFTVSSAFRNVALNAFPGGQIGTAIVNSAGSVVAIIGTRTRSALNSGSTASAGANNCYVPSTVAPGQYKLRTAVKTTDGEWRVATLSVGDTPSAIDLTVSAAAAGETHDGYGMALTSFTSSKTSVSQNELFSASAAFKNVSQEVYTGGQWGIALVNSAGEAKAVGMANLSQRNPGATTGAGNVDCYVPTDVPPGQYKLRMVIRLTNGEWKVAPMYVDDTPSFINFTVTSAEGETSGGGYGLALTSFAASKTNVSQNELFTVSSSLKNVNLEQFQSGGQIGTALVNGNGKIVAVIGARNQGAVNAGSSVSTGTNNCYVPDSVAAGTYSLRTAIKTAGGDWRIATLSVGDAPSAINFTVTKENGTPGGGYGLALTSFTASKTNVSQNELFTVNSAFRNVAQNASPAGQVGTALVNSSGEIAAIIGSRNQNAVNSGSTASSATTYCYVPDSVAAGTYSLRTAIKPANEDWRIATLSAGDAPSAIDFTVTPAAAGNADGYGLALASFATNRISVSQNESFTVSSSLKNVTSEAFQSGGQVLTVLVNSSGEIVETVGRRNQNAINSGATTSSGNNSCSVPSTVMPGTYSLRTAIQPASRELKITALSLSDVPSAIDFTVVAEGGTPGGGYGLELASFSANKLTVSQNEAFTVASGLRNGNSETFQSGGQIGTALTDIEGYIVAIVGTRTQSAINAGSSSTGTNYCYVPSTVAPGQYKLKTAVKNTANGEWRIATTGSLAFKELDFEVTGSGETSNGYELALTSFAASKTTVSQNEAFTVSSAFRNISSNAFSANWQVGTALVNITNGDIEAIVGIRTQSGAVTAGSTVSLGTNNCYVPETIEPGRYRLRTVVKPANGEWKTSTMFLDASSNAIDLTVTRAEGGALSGGHGLALTGFTASKTTVAQNEAFTVSPSFRNIGLDAFPGAQAGVAQIGVALVNNDGNIVEVIKTANFSSLASNGTRSLTLSDCKIPSTIPPGQYRLRIVVGLAGEEWRIATLSLADAPNSINFRVERGSQSADGERYRKSANTGETL